MSNSINFRNDTKKMEEQAKLAVLLLKEYFPDKRIGEIYSKFLSTYAEDIKEQRSSCILLSNKLVLVNTKLLTLRDQLVEVLIHLKKEDLEKILSLLKFKKENYFLFNIIKLVEIYKKINKESDLEDFWLELIEENDFNGALELIKARSYNDNVYYTLSLILLARRVWDQSIEAALLIEAPVLRESLLFIVFRELQLYPLEFKIMFAKIQSSSDGEFIKERFLN